MAWGQPENNCDVTIRSGYDGLDNIVYVIEQGGRDLGTVPRHQIHAKLKSQGLNVNVDGLPRPGKSQNYQQARKG